MGWLITTCSLRLTAPGKYVWTLSYTVSKLLVSFCTFCHKLHNFQEKLEKPINTYIHIINVKSWISEEMWSSCNWLYSIMVLTFKRHVTFFSHLAACTFTFAITPLISRNLLWLRQTFNMIQLMYTCRPSMRYRSCLVKPMVRLLVIWWLLLLLSFVKPQIWRMLQGSSYFVFLAFVSLLFFRLFTCPWYQIIAGDKVSEAPSCRCRWQAGNPPKYLTKKSCD